MENWILLYKYKCPGNETLRIWFHNSFFVLQIRDIKIILFPVWFYYASPIFLKVKMLITIVTMKIMMMRMKFCGFAVMVATCSTIHHVSWGSCHRIFHQRMVLLPINHSWLTFKSFAFTPTQTYRETFIHGRFLIS